MVVFLTRMIIEGRFVIDKVPEKWREDVKKSLIESGYEELATEKGV